MKSTYPRGPGDGHTDQFGNQQSSSGKGKHSPPMPTPSTGNGASENMMGKAFKGPPPTAPPHYSPPTPRTGNGPEDWAEQKTSSPPPAGKGPKLRVPKTVDPPEHGDQISRTSAPANQAPKQSVADGPRQQEAVAVPLRPEGKATGTVRTPPSPQIARRGCEDDYSPITSPTVPPVPAANNGLGDHGHGEDHAYGGKDARRPPGNHGAEVSNEDCTTVIIWP